MAIALAATLWSCGTVNALFVALARHLGGNGELVAQARLGHLFHRLRQQCAQARGVPMRLLLLLLLVPRTCRVAGDKNGS